MLQHLVLSFAILLTATFAPASAEAKPVQGNAHVDMVYAATEMAAPEPLTISPEIPEPCHCCFRTICNSTSPELQAQVPSLYVYPRGKHQRLRDATNPHAGANLGVPVPPPKA